MRILHLNDHLAPVGGAESYLLALIPLLEDEAHEVHVAHATGERELFTQQHRIPALNSIRFRDVAPCSDQVQQLIGRVSPDVVHIHGVQNLGAIQTAVESSRAVLHGHDYRYICPASNFYYKRSKSICQKTSGPGCFATTAVQHCMTPRPRPASYVYHRVRWIARESQRIRRVIAPSEAAASRFVLAGFTRDKVSVVPYFCPLEPREEPRPLPAVPTITFMGRASSSKGWECFLAALARLPRPVRGLMVGNFSQAGTRDLRQRAQQYGCADRLDLESWQGRDAVADVYARTSVFVFPSLWPETMGIVGVEALSQGVPVVACDVGGVREWLRSQENGALISPRDPDGIAMAVQTFLEDPESMLAAGRAGIRLVEEKFKSKRHVKDLIDIYETVAA